MDWEAAISRNREALLRIIIALFALAGMRGRAIPERLTTFAYHKIHHVLRAAESAVRRLIFLSARNLKVAPPVPRAAPIGFGTQPNPSRVPAFNLIDPLKTFGPNSFEPPRSCLSYVSPNDTYQPRLKILKTPTAEECRVLCHRLLAIRAALENLPKQARRLARWQARSRQMLKHKACRVGPFRPGLPPGFRARATHEVDHILLECHRLMRYFTHPPNTSYLS